MRQMAAGAVMLAVLTVGGTPASAAPDDTGPDATVPDDAVDDVTDDQGSVTGGDDADGPPPVLPLIPVPTGCAVPRPPHIVFVGEVVDRDYRTVRFEIERIRSGRSDPFASGGEIDVRLGLDAQYLDDGESYLVSAVVDEDLGLLVSRVSDPIENFGGDDVIGIAETDVNCTELEDPMRTLRLDGTAIGSSVVQPFLDARVRIIGAFVIPFAVAFGIIFVLATLRLSVSGLFRSVADAGRSTR